jgi:D-serine deaminase-like pyridoxal phosphate-dependent protein
MAHAAHGAGIALRPHAKSHKCPAIAELQIERGAAGICCQKVGEAEAFVAAGIPDVLVTNEIVGAGKLARLAALAREATIGVLVDDAASIGHVGAAARAAAVTLDVLVEIDVGAHRCGVAPGAAAVLLAELRAAVTQPAGCTRTRVAHLRVPTSAARGAAAAALPRNEGSSETAASRAP